MKKENYPKSDAKPTDILKIDVGGGQRLKKEAKSPVSLPLLRPKGRGETLENVILEDKQSPNLNSPIIGKIKKGMVHDMKKKFLT